MDSSRSVGWLIHGHYRHDLARRERAISDEQFIELPAKAILERPIASFSAVAALPRFGGLRALPSNRPSTYCFT